MPAAINIIGRTFGRYFVFAEAPNSAAGRRRSWVRCTCGTERIVANCHLISGHTKSCSCLQKEVVSKRELKHGHTRNGWTRIYREWMNMKQRCTNPKVWQFEYYGRRGIKICDRWFNSFENFLSDVGPGKKGWTLHRVDNELGYFLGNMVWATMTFQMRHTRGNHVLTVRGITACLSELCEKFGVNYSRTRSRLARGWSAEEAFFK